MESCSTFHIELPNSLLKIMISEGTHFGKAILKWNINAVQIDNCIKLCKLWL